jgi:hypothetical protein
MPSNKLLAASSEVESLLVATSAAVEELAVAAGAAAEAVESPASLAICIAKTPPKGPAGLGFAILTRQTFDMPATVPEQVVPAGISTVNGCDALAAHPYAYEEEDGGAYVVFVDILRPLH